MEICTESINKVGDPTNNHNNQINHSSDKNFFSFVFKLGELLKTSTKIDFSRIGSVSVDQKTSF
jgi:hypothetical protein